MDLQSRLAQFDPSGIGLKNGHFIGLPFEEADARVVLLPVPWDVTVSYADGTARGGENILDASSQLDLLDPDVPEAWKIGLYMRPVNAARLERSQALREDARKYIDFLEEGGDLNAHPAMQQILTRINRESEALNQWVETQCEALLSAGKLVGLIGGEHSVPLGYLRALAKRHSNFGILQIDAHMDFRKAYEGFTYSHASIFYNALQLPQISRIVQVGIRDYCEEEVAFAEEQGERVHVWYDHAMRRAQYSGRSLEQQVQELLRPLPEHVYVSFDIDALDPRFCPNTGTPVPGGLDFQEAVYLLAELKASGRTIIGFDLSEVAGPPHEWDGNVGARLAYKMANLMGADLSH